MADVGMTYETIQSVQNKLNGHISDLENAMQQIQNEVSSLAGAGWAGAAYGAFENCMGMWNNDVRTVKNDLSTINQTITRVVKDMQSTDAAGSRGFSMF